MEAIGSVRVRGVDNDYSIAIEGGRKRSNPLRNKYSFAPGAQYTNAPAPTPRDAFTPIASVFNGFTHVNTQSYGVSFLDTLKLRPWLLLSGGIRFDYFNAQANAQAIPATGALASNLSRLDKQPTYRAALVIKPTANGSVYFDYGTSFIRRLNRCHSPPILRPPHPRRTPPTKSARSGTCCAAGSM